MRLNARYALVVAGVLSLAGCRQAEGPVPTPNEERRRELGDIARDLENIAAARDPQASQDLMEDLRRYTDGKEAAVPAVDELSRRTAQVLPGTKMTPTVADQLAQNYYLTTMARELSERQTEGLQNDVQSLLMSVGVADQNASQVAEQVGTVQKAVTNRTRRWYELF